MSDAVFLKVNKSGKGYFGEFPGVDGVVQTEVGGDGTLAIKIGTKTDLIAPKTNDYGAYYIAEIGSGRYFLSERENSRGKYMLAKPAAERKDLGGRNVERPKSYGGRK